MVKDFIYEKFIEVCAGVVFLLDRSIEAEDLRDLEPNAVTKKMMGYIEHSRLAIKEIEELAPRLQYCKEWDDVYREVLCYDFDSEENEAYFQTENAKGTIFQTTDGRFAIDHNIIVLNPEGNFLKFLFPDGEEREFDLNKHYAIEEAYQKELENINNQEYGR